MKTKMILFLLMLGWSLNSFAKMDQWVCTTESSQRIGNTVHACGVANGKDENEARALAFDNAKLEFFKICDSSADCRGHELKVDPARTTCEAIDSGFKCFRMVSFAISDKIASVIEEHLPTWEEAIAAQPVQKIKRGMTIKQVVTILGEPSQVMADDMGLNAISLIYNDRPFCEKSFCQVTFMNKRVIDWNYFKSYQTDFLAGLD